MTTVEPSRDHRLGREALHFARWFATDKFRLMQEFLGELREDPLDRDPAALERRFVACTTHARRVLRARGVVTALLALGALATAGTSAAAVLVARVPLLGRAAAIAAGLTVLLLVARLMMDRYLDRVETSATFLAIELATASSTPSMSARLPR